jgi:hypothetical protein
MLRALMNTAVFVERLGKQPPDPPEAVADILGQIWISALYPNAGPNHPQGW